MPQSSGEFTEELIRRIIALEDSVRTQGVVKSQFSILNASHAEPITATVNNFDIGDYDFVYAIPDANRIINGITNGYNGRFLQIRNGSGFTLSFTHLNAGADVQNRIATVSLATIVLGARQTAEFIYVSDTTLVASPLWLLIFPFS